MRMRLMKCLRTATLRVAMLVVLLVAIEGLAAVPPAVVPSPNLDGSPVNYLAWFREQIDPLREGNAYQIYEPYFLHQEGDTKPSRPLLKLPQEALEQINALLRAPHRWEPERFPALAAAITRARPALRAYREGTDKLFVCPVPTPQARSLLDILAQNVTYSRFATDLLLADGLAATGTLISGPTEAMQLVLLHAKQLSFQGAPMPLVQLGMSVRLRQRVYALIEQMLEMNMLDRGQIVVVLNAMRRTDATPLPHLLAAGLSMEQVRAFELMQDWVVPGEHRLSASRMRGFLNEVLPRPDSSLIRGVDPKAALDAVAEHWQRVYDRLLAEPLWDLPYVIKEMEEEFARRDPFAAEFLVYSIAEGVQAAVNAESARQRVLATLEQYAHPRPTSRPESK